LAAGTSIVVLLAALLVFVLVREAGITDDARDRAAGEPVTTPTPDEPAVDEDNGGEEPDPIAVPTPDTTGRDFDRIFGEIAAFRDWLFANPNPDLLSTVFHVECDCYEPTFDALTYFQQEELRTDDDGTIIHAVEVAEEFETVVRLRIQMQRTPQVVVDRRGSVVEETDGTGIIEYSVSLVRQGERWLVMTITAIGTE
jgi:hypothetical protein